ncbi:MAG TPA: hypothetical protein VMI10_15810 [Terriglobales bacterium]|nr:hypothetical protein [Terriglobales bacterium]
MDGNDFVCSLPTGEPVPSNSNEAWREFVTSNRRRTHRVHGTSLSQVFAVAKIHFDHPQARTYLDAAQEQLHLAREQVEAERTLCQCDPPGVASRLDAMSELDGLMNSTRDALLP